MDLSARLTGLVARSLRVKPARLKARRPVASITFDDFPKSAWVEGGPLLARYGARATFYTAGSFCGRTVEGLRYYDRADLWELSEAGHEIGCHGFAHQPATVLSRSALTADADRNGDFLKDFLGGKAAASYAFPFGSASLGAKRFFARRFSNLRGVHPGINMGTADLAQLRCMSLECKCWDEDAILAAIRRAREGNGWIVFHTHDVSDRPTQYGSMPGMLAWVLKKLAEAQIEVLPMREALEVAAGTTAASSAAPAPGYRSMSKPA